MSDIDRLIARLHEESGRLSGRSLDHGCADSGIAANLADEAATALQDMKAEVERLKEKLNDTEWSRNLYISLEREAESRLSSLRDEVIEALRPFAECAPQDEVEVDYLVSSPGAVAKARATILSLSNAQPREKVG